MFTGPRCEEVKDREGLLADVADVIRVPDVEVVHLLRDDLEHDGVELSARQDWGSGLRTEDHLGGVSDYFGSACSVCVGVVVFVCVVYVVCFV